MKEVSRNKIKKKNLGWIRYSHKDEFFGSNLFWGKMLIFWKILAATIQQYTNIIIYWLGGMWGLFNIIRHIKHTKWIRRSNDQTPGNKSRNMKNDVGTRWSIASICESQGIKENTDNMTVDKLYISVCQSLPESQRKSRARTIWRSTKGIIFSPLQKVPNRKIYKWPETRKRSLRD